MKKLVDLFLSLITLSLILSGGYTQAQMPSVESLKDVEPRDWAYESLRSLIEKYDLVAGYPDHTFQGDRPLSRYEFAALLNEALNRLNELSSDEMGTDDVATIEQLVQKFSSELAIVQGRTDGLEARIGDLEATQFSTTTKLTGQVIMAANAGGFEGESIIAPRGATIAESDPQATFIYRAVLFFNSSFQGTDQLQIRLVTGSAGTEDNTGGLLEPNFGSNLDYTIQGRNNQISLARAFYQFSPIENVNLVIGPVVNVADYIDNNSLIGASFRSFSTLAFANNYVLFPRPLGGGAIAEWNLGGGAFHLRAGYAAGNSGTPLPGNDRLFGGGGTEDVRLFPAGGGGAEGGLFDDPRQGAIEIEYAPSNAFALKIHYVGGEIFGSDFQGVGVNLEWSILPQIGIFGRYGYSDYPNTTIGDLNPNYWLAGLSFSDLLVEGSLSGIAVAQPFIESAAGNATQTNFEVFYNYPINDSINISPILQIVSKPGNQSSNGNIYSGTLRGVFSF